MTLQSIRERLKDKRTIPCALFLVACLIYSNTLSAEFTYDDNFAVVRNADVYNSSASLRDIWKHDFWGQDFGSEQSHKSYRPLTTICFRMQRVIGGLIQNLLGTAVKGESATLAFPFHATNILLHGCMTVLVYRLSHTLVVWRSGLQCRWPYAKKDYLSRYATVESCLAGLLFALHPIHTDAVASVVGQAELLAGVATLIGLKCCFVSDLYRIDNYQMERFHPYATALIFCFLGALFKETAIAMLAPLLMIEILNRVRTRTDTNGTCLLPERDQMNTSTRSGREPILKYCICTFGVLEAYISLRKRLAGNHLVSIYRKVENPIPFLETRLERIMTTAHLHSRYAWQLIFPKHLSVDWSFPCIEPVQKPSYPRNLLGILVYVPLLYLIYRCHPMTVLFGSSWRSKLQQKWRPIPSGLTDVRTANSGNKRMSVGERIVEHEGRQKSAANTAGSSMSETLKDLIQACEEAQHRVEPQSKAAAGGESSHAVVSELEGSNLAGSRQTSAAISEPRQSQAAVQKETEGASPQQQQKSVSCLKKGHIRSRRKPGRGQIAVSQDGESDGGTDTSGESVEFEPITSSKGHTRLSNSAFRFELDRRVEDHSEAFIKAERKPEISLQLSWFLLVVFGLMVAPFLPASNAFFYVGTFMAERLLYLPSVGFCLLLSRLLCYLFMSQQKSQDHKDGKNGNRKAQIRKGQPKNPAFKSPCRLSLFGIICIACLLGAFGVKTWQRNKDWKNEESLFRAAEQVCPRSSKVQLNLGILARRHQDWGRASHHFIMAQTLEPSYCEPIYWMGLTFLSSGNPQQALKLLEKSLGCKYVSAEASETLIKLFDGFRNQEQHKEWATLEQARIWSESALQDPIGGCNLLEDYAYQNDRKDLTLKCDKWLARKKDHNGDKNSRHLRKARATMLKCMKQRRRLNSMLQTDELPEIELEAFSYLEFENRECRNLPGTATASAGHTHLMHQLLEVDPLNPWLQMEWAAIQQRLSKPAAAKQHYQAALGLLLMALIGEDNSQGWKIPGLHPLSRRMEELGPVELQLTVLHVVRKINELSLSLGEVDCELLDAEWEYFVKLEDLAGSKANLYAHARNRDERKRLFGMLHDAMESYNVYELYCPPTEGQF